MAFIPDKRGVFETGTNPEDIPKVPVGDLARRKPSVQEVIEGRIECYTEYSHEEQIRKNNEILGQSWQHNDKKQG